MKHEQTQKSAILPWARKTAGNTSRQIARACLATVDWYHREWLRVKQGERAVAPTKRIRFSKEVKLRVSAGQGNTCMYCGTALAGQFGLDVHRTHLDHKIPIEHGGSNVDGSFCCHFVRGYTLFRNTSQQQVKTVGVQKVQTVAH